ncbi:hypothetical protein AMJ85_00045 [candidate division BRC1 bacterium SM23_51]|nr:MAG: hypothetical protein AMJ85_00045 [candidate division BRC1 bacterium SM23_51]
MKLSVNSGISLVLFGFVAAIMLGGRAANADFTFGEPVNLESVFPFLDPDEEGISCFSSDALEMYIESYRPGGQGGCDLWVLRRTSINEGWGEPNNLGPAVNSPECDQAAWVSTDGLTLLFTSDQRGYNDIYVTTRPTRDARWGQAVYIGPPINGPTSAVGALMSADGLELYFSAWQRPGGFGNFDLWVTKRTTTDGTWGEPENLGPAVNSPYDEAWPSLSPDGRVLFFCGNNHDPEIPQRPGGYGRADMWMTMRETLSDHWQPPVNLGPKVNSSKHDFGSCISPDGSTLYFFTISGNIWENWQAPIIPIVDFNGDGQVDLEDYSELAQYWCQNEPSVDMGPTPLGDGIVDSHDALVLAKYWLTYPGVVAHWKLDETEGFIAHDSAGDHDAFVIAEDPLWRPDDGKIDGALELDGINDYVGTPFVLNPAQGSFSVFMWAKGGLPGQALLSQNLSTDWLYTLHPMGWLMTSLGQGGPLLSEVVITDGEWHRIGFTWDGTNRTLYVDDVEAAKDTQTALQGADRGLNIGAGKDLGPATFFSGLIDDIRIYDRAVKP